MSLTNLVFLFVTLTIPKLRGPLKTNISEIIYHVSLISFQQEAQAAKHKKGLKCRRTTNIAAGPLRAKQLGTDEEGSLPAQNQQALAAAVQGSMPTIVSQVTSLLAGVCAHPVASLVLG